MGSGKIDFSNLLFYPFNKDNEKCLIGLKRLDTVQYQFVSLVTVVEPLQGSSHEYEYRASRPYATTAATA